MSDPADAWIKYYRQDENAPNALVSYYLKGSLILVPGSADSRAPGRKSLDDVLRALWQRYGKTGVGVPEDGWERIAEEVSGLRLHTFFDRALRSTEELPLKQALASVGVELHLRQAESATDRGGRTGVNSGARAGRGAGRRVALGARTTEDSAGVKLTRARRQRAPGLAAGDVLVALDGLRVNQRTWTSICNVSRRRQVRAFRVN